MYSGEICTMSWHILLAGMLDIDKTNSKKITEKITWQQGKRALDFVSHCPPDDGA